MEGSVSRGRGNARQQARPLGILQRDELDSPLGVEKLDDRFEAGAWSAVGVESQDELLSR